MNQVVVKPILLALAIYLSGVSCAMSQNIQAPSLSMYAGSMSGEGNVDGPASMASFRSPQTLAVDGEGNLYVVDGESSNTIRKINKEGVVTTLAGTSGESGSADGKGASASFYKPRGIAVDTQGNVYVADTMNHSLRKIDPAGVVTTLAGGARSGSDDGVGTKASFFLPECLAVDVHGNIYVSSDYRIRKISPSGLVTTLAGKDQAWPGKDGKGTEATFSNINGIAVDRQGNVFVTEFSAIRKISPDGVVTTIAEKYTPLEQKFSELGGITLDAEGNLFVFDKQAIRKVDVDGNVTTLVGVAAEKGNLDGRGMEARLGKTYSDLASDSAGNLFFADAENHSIRKITRDGLLSTVAGKSVVVTGPRGYDAEKFRVNSSSHMISDSAGNLYVSYQSHIFKITPDRKMTSRDLARWNNDLNNIGEMVFASDGTLYFVNEGRHSSRDSGAGGPGNWLPFSRPRSSPSQPNSIYKLLVDGSVKQVAGKSANIATGGLVIDSKGDLYSAGYGTLHKIKQRSLLSSKVVPFLAPDSGGYSLDGLGILGVVTGVAIDSANNIYVSDIQKNLIRKVSPSGVVSILAGSAAASSPDELDEAAGVGRPKRIVADASGNLYVIDIATHRVRKITPNGQVSTLVGTHGKEGFQGGPLPGIISRPQALAIHGSSLYILMVSSSMEYRHWIDGASSEGFIAVVNNLP